MRNTFLLSLLLGVISINLCFGQNLTEGQTLQRAEKLSGDVFPYVGVTKKGVRIYAVKKPRMEMLNAIDKGLSDLFAVARKNNYTQRLQYSDYVIFIAKADRQTDSDGNYIPNFAIPVRQYAGTAYDKGGFMYAAGLILATNPLAFMIAENEKKLNLVSEVVRFEGEHLVLYHNDRRRYNETADHSRGGGHPILQ